MLASQVRLAGLQRDAAGARGPAMAMQLWPRGRRSGCRSASGAGLAEAPGRAQARADRARLEQGVGLGARAHAGMAGEVDFEQHVASLVRVDHATADEVGRGSRCRQQRRGDQAAGRGLRDRDRLRRAFSRSPTASAMAASGGIGPPRPKVCGPASVRHQRRHGHLGEDRPGHAAEHELAHPGMAIGAHHQKVRALAGEVRGGSRWPCRGRAPRRARRRS